MAPNNFLDGEVYNFVWPDGAIAEFEVLGTDYKTFKNISIRYLTNGVKSNFMIGSDMYKNSYLKGSR